jgi:hypothetical protein
MSEEKGVRELERELKAARIREQEQHAANVTKSRDYSIGGIDKDSTVEKEIPDSADIPDVIILPKKAKNRKENIPF